MIKTSVMMIGEFEFGTLLLGLEAVDHSDPAAVHGEQVYTSKLQAPDTNQSMCLTVVMVIAMLFLFTLLVYFLH